MNNAIKIVGLATILLCCAGLTAQATVWVANNGTDSPTCGTSLDPCRSINQGIANLTYDGELLKVGPGTYSSLTEPATAGCGGCLIHINRRVQIKAIDGPTATVLDGRGTVGEIVRISASGVVFGSNQKEGFLITGSTTDGLTTTAATTNVTIAGNLSIRNAERGFDLGGTNHKIRYNKAIDNTLDGFRFLASAANYQIEHNWAIRNMTGGFVNIRSGSMLKRNVAMANVGDGFRSSAAVGTTFQQNVASDNTSEGFRVSGAGSANLVFDGNVASANDAEGFEIATGANHTLRKNSAIGNTLAGIRTLVTAVTITQNNLFGNIGGVGGGIMNCGLQNSSGAGITATNNFWGAAAGPGADPADLACGPDPIVTAPVATFSFGIPFLPSGL